MNLLARLVNALVEDKYEEVYENLFSKYSKQLKDLHKEIHSDMAELDRKVERYEERVVEVEKRISDAFSHHEELEFWERFKNLRTEFQNVNLDEAYYIGFSKRTRDTDEHLFGHDYQGYRFVFIGVPLISTPIRNQYFFCRSFGLNYSFAPGLNRHEGSLQKPSTAEVELSQNINKGRLIRIRDREMVYPITSKNLLSRISNRRQTLIGYWNNKTMSKR